MGKEYLMVFLELLSVVLFLFSIYFFARTDRKLPYIEARKKSIRKGFTFLLLSFISLLLLTNSLKPMNLETLIFCIFGSILFLLISYGIALAQINMIKKTETTSKIFYPDENDK